MKHDPLFAQNILLKDKTLSSLGKEAEDLFFQFFFSTDKNYQELKKDNLKFLKEKWANDPNFIKNFKDNAGNNLLHYFVSFNHFEVFKFLIDKVNYKEKNDQNLSTYDIIKFHYNNDFRQYFRIEINQKNFLKNC